MQEAVNAATSLRIGRGFVAPGTFDEWVKIKGVPGLTIEGLAATSQPMPTPAWLVTPTARSG